MSSAGKASYMLQYAILSSVALLAKKQELTGAIADNRAQYNNLLPQRDYAMNQPWSESGTVTINFLDQSLTNVGEDFQMMQDMLSAVNSLIPVAQINEAQAQNVVTNYIASAITPAQSGQLNEIAASQVAGTSGSIQAAAIVGAASSGTLAGYLNIQSSASSGKPNRSEQYNTDSTKKTGLSAFFCFYQLSQDGYVLKDSQTGKPKLNMSKVIGFPIAVLLIFYYFFKNQKGGKNARRS